MYSALLSILCLVSMFSLSAQTPRRDSGADGLAPAVEILAGETLPEHFWLDSVTIYNHGVTERIVLQQFRGKPLLLDFWNTTCSTCIVNMPKMYETEPVRSKKLNFLAVTYEDGIKVSKIARNNKYLNSIPFQSIVNSKSFHVYFPHASVPYYVLINAKGKVQTIFGGLEWDVDKLNELLSNPEKIVVSELTNNTAKYPMLLASRYSKQPGYSYSFFANGRNDELGRCNIIRKENDHVYSLSMINIPLMAIASKLARIYFAEQKLPFYHKFVEFQKNEKKKGLDSLDVYTLEYVQPKGKKQSIVSDCLSILNTELKSNIHFESKQVEFWEIYDIPKSKQEIQWQNERQFSILATSLIKGLPDEPLFLDATAGEDLSIPFPDKLSIQIVKQILATHSLGIRKIKISIPILIVS